MLFEECDKCGKIILDDEYVTNWGTCDVCFDEAFEEYLHNTHLKMQLKIDVGD